MSASRTLFMLLNWTCTPLVFRTADSSRLPSLHKFSVDSTPTELLGALRLQSCSMQHPHSQLFSPQSDPSFQGMTSAPSQPGEGLLSCEWPLQHARQSRQGGGMKAAVLLSWAAQRYWLYATAGCKILPSSAMPWVGRRGSQRKAVRTICIWQRDSRSRMTKRHAETQPSNVLVVAVPPNITLQTNSILWLQRRTVHFAA